MLRAAALPHLLGPVPRVITAGSPPRPRFAASSVHVKLLAFPIAFLVLGLLLLALARQQPLTADVLSGAGIFAAGLVATAVWVRWRLPGADPVLLPIAACLASIGQVMVSRLVPDLGPRQGIWVLVGFLALVLVTSIPSATWLVRYRYTWGLLSLLLLIATLLFGTDPNGSGARLWFVVGPVSIQPIELTKILLVVFLAAYLEEYRELLAAAGRRIGPVWLPPLPYLAPILGITGVTLVILLVQHDLGPGLLLAAVSIAMLYMASGRGSYVLLGVSLVALAGVVADRLLPYVHTRVVIWLNPWAEAQGSAYQLVQALYAFASGGVFGTGLDYGAPLNIPAVHTDFVIAAIGEELGLVGTLAVVNLFVLFTMRGFRIALAARSGFNALLAAGLSAVMAFQALIILAGTLDLTPLTGITLPFVSYGGSSVVANFLLVGLLLLVSHEEARSRQVLAAAPRSGDAPGARR